MAKTWVFWDINSCPVPKDCDARLVGSSIESALKKAGYCEGDLTITAIGNLNHILQLNPDFLQAIFSTGIRLCHTPPGFFTDSVDDILRFENKIPSPATLMVITGDVHLEHVTAHFPYLRSEGYTPLLAYPSKSKEPPSDKNFSWETILKGSEEMGPSRIDESFREFSCKLCSADGRTFEDFTTHLRSKNHLERELCKLRRPSFKRKMEKPDFNVSEYNNKRSKRSEFGRERPRRYRREKSV
ncbi:hypothetical protein Bca101_010988 [Brassica carinata]